ncbi:hypothetical protein ACFQJ7_09285 [Halovenus rubra]|uniref:Uncharacterized protein n=2 Tax=Halovenus rubra TaxID=869890 RepID=A0ABD5X4W0_9EURY
MILGAFIAGAAATARLADPADAGARAGFLGGVVAVGTSVAGSLSGSPSTLLFLPFAGAVVLSVAPLFGLLCGRLGAWTSTKLLTDTGRNAGRAN